MTSASTHPTLVKTLMRWQEHWLSIAGVVSLLIFAWLPDSYLKMRSWPWIVIWQFGWLAIARSAVWRLRQFQRPWQWLGHGLDQIFLTLVLVLLITCGFAMDRGLAFLNCLLVFAYIIALYLFRNSLSPKPSHIRRFWMGFVVVSTVSSLIALWLWQPTTDMWLSNRFYDALRNRFPLGHHNFSGGYFALTLPMAVAFAIAHTGWRRCLGAITSLSIAIALYSSGSRGAWLGSSVALLISFGTVLWQSHGKQRWQVFLISFLCAGGVILLFLSNPRIRSFDIHRQGPTFDRILMVRAAGNILNHRPLVGVGPGNMAHAYNVYRPIEGGTGLEMAQQLHNLPVQIAGELGYAGLIVYGWLLFNIAKLWIRLNQSASNHTERWLLYGIGLSGLSYAVSSLTDYQLENIPIAATLICLLLLLILKADQAISQGSPSSTSVKYASVPLRRLLSLSILSILLLQFSFWGATSIAIYFNQSAIKKANNNQLVEAEADFIKAAKLNPWDPTPNALMAQLMYDVSRAAPTAEDRQLLMQQTINYYLNALAASPNDAWFNNNLALLYLQAGDPGRAEAYAERAISLYPRNYNYTYYTLGLVYLAQAKVEQAIDALALEMLASPNFITMQIWHRDPLASLQPRILDKAISYYEHVQSLLGPDHLYGNQLYEQSLLIRWWAERSLPETIQWQRLRPIVQAVIQANTEPEQALMLVKQQLETFHDTEGLKLLRAWLKPDLYLEQYLASADLSEEEAVNIRSEILEKRMLKDWLTASVGTPSERKRGSLSLAYRNASANGITSILRPEALEYSILPNQVLQLFVAMPRDLPILDELMESIRAEQLNLVHSTRNRFELAPLELPPSQSDRD
ncbi:O-antigen ligase family protein [Leptothoe spongobia]|uniref:O-antigen ligase family protein n=1 Tax=Leptothoe spongobia TAU-MAC 1115 TaxID=1967444 RepID=A0A947DDT7_9CYAN|nr:O-antigen ligase family protein [Leptothoe spongobia]MBT9315232.1 O-antigen ligase family protein [Leptothoe spongobia TAU-MAC 1115]